MIFSGVKEQFVTGGSARHGRRDNGLFAAQYAAVGDVDPRVGEHLLDVLGNRGIAAYLQPTSDQFPVTRLTALPARPLDRLYVDRSEMDTAREFLDVLTKDGEVAGPAPVAPRSSSEFDNAWASIVAGFDQTTEHETTPWPTIEDVTTHGTTTTAETPRERDVPTGNRPGSLLYGLDSFGSDLADDDDDDDYEPPVPPPLPHLASITIVAIIGIIVGIAVILDPDLLPIDPTLGAILGASCLVAGAVALIGRLRSGRDDDDLNDPDHGAVV
jgi:hypothetical protein